LPACQGDAPEVGAVDVAAASSSSASGGPEPPHEEGRLEGRPLSVLARASFQHHPPADPIAAPAQGGASVLEGRGRRRGVGRGKGCRGLPDPIPDQLPERQPRARVFIPEEEEEVREPSMVPNYYNPLQRRRADGGGSGSEEDEALGKGPARGHRRGWDSKDLQNPSDIEWKPSQEEGDAASF